MKKRIIFLFAAILLISSYSQAESRINFPTYIPGKYRPCLEAWLSAHPSYRIAIETDCTYCDNSIKDMRTKPYGDWKPLPDYQPYFTVGDFNSDSVDDFAVAVIDELKRDKKFRILVFNGPFNTSSLSKPAFVSGPIDLSNAGMFYGGPRPKPWRLLAGPFESEGTLLVPQGKTYKWESK